MITIKELIEEVRRLVAESPDNAYTHAQCRYSIGACNNGSVGCLFGQALSNLGVDVVALDAMDSVPSILGILSHGNVVGSCTELEKSWCNLTQQRKDMGLSWSEAIRGADDRYGVPYPIN